MISWAHNCNTVSQPNPCPAMYNFSSALSSVIPFNDILHDLAAFFIFSAHRLDGQTVFIACINPAPHNTWRTLGSDGLLMVWNTNNWHG